MPYKAPGLGDPRIDWILLEVNKAQNLLDSKILEAQNLPDTEPSKGLRIARLNQMKREVDNAFAELTKNISIWADRDISNFYQRGHTTAAAQLSAGFGFTLPHQEALDIISFDAYDDVATHLQQVSQGFGTNVELQKIFEGLDPSQITAIQEKGRSAVAQLLLTGEDPRKISRALAQDLWSQGISIIDSGGRQWNPEKYTRMLIRTKSANAYNAGSMNKYAEEGVTRVKVFDGVEDDPECAEAAGQTWSLEYAMLNVIQHPNCRRAFGPLQGDGPVDRRSEHKVSVIFDRIELGVASIAAIRAFRRTGEINVSSTLARLVLEFIEFQAGFGLPLIDNFIMGAVGQGFRNADSWVESYVDPILFAAGLIKEIPLRAQIVRMQNPSKLIDAVEAAVLRAATNLGIEHPGIQQTLNKIGEIIRRVDNSVTAAVSDGSLGGLKWVPWVAEELSFVHRFGQIVGETLLSVKNGGGTDLQRLWAESAVYVDDMIQLRVAHQTLMLANHEEAVLLAQKVAAQRRELKVLLETGDPLTAELSTLSDVLVGGTTARHLRELDDELAQIQYSAFNKAQETKQLAIARDRKSLPFPASAGPDYPSEVGTYWDLDEFSRDVAEVHRVLSNAENVPRFDIAFVREVGEVLQKMDQKASQVLLEGSQFFLFGKTGNELAREIVERAPKKVSDDLIERGVIIFRERGGETKAYLVGNQGLVNYFGDVLAKVEFDGSKVLFDGALMTDEDLGVLRYIMQQTETIFLSAEVFGNEVEYIPVFANILRRTNDDSLTSLHVLWSQTVNSQLASRFDLNRVDQINSHNLHKLLRTLFPGQVEEITGGINGAKFIITTSSGNKLFFKQLIPSPFGGSGGLQGRAKGTLSQVLTSWVGREVGELEVVPVRGWSTKQGDAWGLVMPALDDAETVGDAGAVLRDDQIRRMSFLDMIDREHDGHSYNWMWDPYNETLFAIDREAGWFHESRGFTSNVPYSRMQRALIDSFEAGEDTDFGGVTARLIKLSDDEAEFARGGTYQSFGSMDSRTPVPIFHNNDESFLITGAVGKLNVAGDEYWFPSLYLTDSELEFVLNPNRYEDMVDEVLDILGDLTEGAKREFIDSSGLSGTFEEVVEDLLRDASTTLNRRIRQMIDGGLFNIAGGVEDYVSPSGLRATIGETIQWVGPDGVNRYGTVVNIFEDTNGNTIAHVAGGVGFKQTRGQLVSQDPFTIINLSDPLVRISDDGPVITFAGTIRDRLSNLPDFDELPMSAVTYEVDNVGIFREARRQVITIENRANSEVTLFYRLGKVKANYSIPEETNKKLISIIEDVINEQPLQQRPLKVVLSGKPFETVDGRKAFGMFDADDRTLYVSVTGLFPNVKADVNGKLLFDSVDALNEAADLTNFERVVRHEVAHASVIGKELETRALTSELLLERILDEFPELSTQEDFFRFAEEALRKHGRLDLLGSENPLETLIDFRLSVLEDIANSNRVAAARRLADQGLPDHISPEIVHAIKRGEPEAHQELLAEITGLEITPRQWAFENHLDVDDVHLLENGWVRNAVPIDEEHWFGARLADFIDLSLRGDDVALVPLVRSPNRQFWKEADLNVPYLISRGREVDGGFTYDVVTEFEPPRGFAVAIKPNELIIDDFSDLTDAEFKAILENYVAENRKLLDQDDWFLGGWHDSDNNKFYLDTTKVFTDEVAAAHFAFKEEQLALFNLQTFETKNVLSKYRYIEDYIKGEIPEYRRLKGDLVDVLQTKNKTRVAFQSDVIGRPPSMSLSNIPKAKRLEFLEKLAKKEIYEVDSGKVVDASQAAIRKRLEAIIKRAEIEYQSNPALREEHRFYEKWNLDFRKASVETNIPFNRIVAGAAAASPNLDSGTNYEIALFMAYRLGNDAPMSQADVIILKRYYEQISKDYLGYSKTAKTTAKAAEKVAASKRYAEWAKAIQVGDRLSEMGPEQVTRTLHILRNEETGAGFPAQNFRQFQKAVMVMRGEIDPQDALGDTKVRSFANNILDPLNKVGVGDVTVDFHMMDASFNGNTGAGDVLKGVTPSVDGLAWGYRVIIADIVRDLFDEGFGLAVQAESPAQLQEIIWNIWILGRKNRWWGDLPLMKERTLK